MARGTQNDAAPLSASSADEGAASVASPDVRGQSKEPDPYDVARQIVLKQLAMAPRSRAELFKKLAERGCAAEVAVSVLDRMTQVGLIDDQAYAQMFVRSRQAARGLAKGALARELRAKGIESHLVDEVLASISDEDEHDRARALVDKKLRAMHGLGIEVQTRRLAAMLARKGYSARVTYAAIREAVAEAPEHLPD